ncbi:polyprenyl synthetase family protein [Aliikangiella sp. G2MR2-5]|uniref:polyprenyl synthetase family protein n=1 Tax=Aliikangiella sp. G2MR2-5 TaxID=2788943 RepID=UPI001FED7A10|nr:polyprenyl synthetase family protein [Aliikangiella sp. G2MR2-5]
MSQFLTHAILEPEASRQSEEKQLAKNISGDFYVDPACYAKAEKRADWYLNQIHLLAKADDSLEELTKDFFNWKENYKTTGLLSLSELESRAQLQASVDSWTFLEKLEADNKLKEYLEKSISYLFMRDLGKSLNDRDTKKKLNSIVKRIHRWLRSRSEPSDQSTAQKFNELWLYRKSREIGISSTIQWLMGKLATVQEKMPEHLDKTNGMRKLVKIIAGVILHQLIDLPQELDKKSLARRLDKAIRLGYCYGLTYPLVDDLQDSSKALSFQDKQKFNQAIKQSFLQGKVVDCPEFSKDVQESMKFVYRELRESFETIKESQSEEYAREFFEQAFIFFTAQDIDRQRRLEHGDYSIEELYNPIILKSAGCRLVARELVDSRRNDSFDYRTFCFGIYNQFNDDIKDIFDDLREGNVTPYSYYLFHQKSEGKITLNPYRIYWAVVYYLINNVFESHPLSKQLLLERSINAHKNLRSSIGEEQYLEVEVSLLKTGNEPFDRLIHQLVRTPNDIAWFDKLVSREVSHFFSTREEDKKKFREKYQNTRKFVDSHVLLPQHARLKSQELRQAANYSLEAGGKRIRSVMAYVFMTEKYGFSDRETVPVLQLLEQMHTASIIFDDKPSQDNAPIRRGRPALHTVCESEAKAELAGLYLMMNAVEVQTKVKGVKPEYVLESIRYAANTTQAICEGQLLDLESVAEYTDAQKLHDICFLKTALAIEAAVMIPAILAGENDIQKGKIKSFCHHLGLAFQIKDDLLDVESSTEVLGKPVQHDSARKKASFVTCLGEKGARDKLIEHYFKAKEIATTIENMPKFISGLVDYLVNRVN